MTENVEEVQTGPGKVEEQDLFAEVWMRKTVKRHVQEFALIIGIVLICMAGYGAWNGWMLPTNAALIVTGLGFAALGYFVPRALHRVWRSWMTLAEVMCTVVTTLLLLVMWFLMFIPIGVSLKLTGKRIMDLAFKLPVSSYLETRDPAREDFKFLARQY